MLSVSKTVVHRDGYRHCFVVSHFPDDAKGIIVATKITLCVTKRCKIQFGKCADKYDVVSVSSQQITVYTSLRMWIRLIRWIVMKA